MRSIVYISFRKSPKAGCGLAIHKKSTSFYQMIVTISQKRGIMQYEVFEGSKNSNTLDIFLLHLSTKANIKGVPFALLDNLKLHQGNFLVSVCE
jgi:hypothetical protein